MQPRFPASPKVYRYDGTFGGFLCCVFESFLKKETPAAILPEDGPYELSRYGDGVDANDL